MQWADSPFRRIVKRVATALFVCLSGLGEGLAKPAFGQAGLRRFDRDR
jgi:hypothetical protein